MASRSIASPRSTCRSSTNRRRERRRGLGSEAARALVAYGLEQLRLERIIALIDPEHEASIGTARKAGLAFDREIEMDGVRSAVYSITRLDL